MNQAKNLPKLFWSGFVLIFIAFLAVLIYRLAKPASPTFSPPIYGKVPSFSLTNQFNQAVTRESLLGKVWIANFIFTTCPGPCLLMSRQVKKIQNELRSDDNIYLISFTVDPETDTPSVLASYAQKLEADPEHWFFLTGKQNDIFHLATKGFLLAVVEAKEAEVSRENGRYIHSTKFALVDVQGRVRAYYEGTQEGIISSLLKEARLLSHEKIP